jgi:hypothetical protein
MDMERGPVGRSDSAASFNYSDVEISKALSRCSSGEEFEFPLPAPATSEERADLYGEEAEKPGTGANGVAIKSLEVVETTAQKMQQLETQKALDEALQHLDDQDWKQANGEDREFDPGHLYAKVNKRRKVRGEEGRAHVAANNKRQSGEVDWMEGTCEDSDTKDVEQILPHSEVDTRRGSEFNVRGPPPLPLPPPDSDPRPISGIYEEVEARNVQVPIVDSNGYTEVGGGRARGPELGYEVGYSGIGSLHKLRNMLGPEFSTMTGGKVKDISGPLPEGRCAVKVVLLNGKAVEFVVGVSAATSELFEQVASYQSLRETHVFGLAIRQDRDDIFLDTECRLVRYAPPGWAHSTHHTPFTVFFRVKYYVENVSQLSQPLTWHLYYLQLRKDLMGKSSTSIHYRVCCYHSVCAEGKMFCHDEPALQLAALALQAERGDCSLGRAGHAPHVRVEDYVPARVIEKLGGQYVGNLLSSMHKERCGLSRVEAELDFLKVNVCRYCDVHSSKLL